MTASPAPVGAKFGLPVIVGIAAGGDGDVRRVDQPGAGVAVRGRGIDVADSWSAFCLPEVSTKPPLPEYAAAACENVACEIRSSRRPRPRRCRRCRR